MRILYTIYWQLKKTIKTIHFNPLFFIIGQLLWPILLLGTFYLGYSPLIDNKDSFLKVLSDSESIWSYLLPGIILTYIFMEFVTLGIHLSMDRDYGVLEPIFISPVNRVKWLMGNTTSAVPSGLLAATGFLISSSLIFSIKIHHPFYILAGILFIIATSLPWGGTVCTIFLSGRNQRVLYSLFEVPAEFMSGVRFPITALPSILSTIAVAFPLAHSVALLRLLFKKSIPWSLVMNKGVILLGLSLIYLVIAILLFKRAESRGKRDGNLTFT